MLFRFEKYPDKSRFTIATTVHSSDRPIMWANLCGRKHARVMAALPWAISPIIVDGTDKMQAMQNHK